MVSVYILLAHVYNELYILLHISYVWYLKVKSRYLVIVISSTVGSNVPVNDKITS